MTDRRPAVSVLIPTYNRAWLLKQSLESVLAQTWSDFEVVISDNASTDDTERLVKSYKDERIVYWRNQENIGWQRNMWQVLSLAKGDLMGFLPDDDLMMPENLASKVAVFTQYPNVGLVHSKYHVIDENGKIIRPDTNWKHGPDRTVDAVEPGANVLKALLVGFNTINLPTVLFRRTCYERLGGFATQLYHADDYEYWMKVAAHYDIAFLAKPLVMWRFHSGTLTNQYCAGSVTGVSNEGLREQLLAKYLILDAYPSRVPDYAHVRQAVDHVAVERVASQAEAALEAGNTPRDVRIFLLAMCRQFPRLLTSLVLWRTFAKTILSRRIILWLKRVGRW